MRASNRVEVKEIAEFIRNAARAAGAFVLVLDTGGCPFAYAFEASACSQLRAQRRAILASTLREAAEMVERKDDKAS